MDVKIGVWSNSSIVKLSRPLVIFVQAVRSLMETYIINPRAFGEMTEEQFFQFCLDNQELRIERNSRGQIIIMPPTGTETSKKNIDIYLELGLWNRKTKLGVCFDSNGGFTLPDSSVKAADAAWITQIRWEAIPREDREKFAHICPDFVIELMSKNDTLRESQQKMREWMDNGCRLGWLLAPKQQHAYVYHANGSFTEVNSFDNTLSGEDVLPDFVLDLRLLK
jgi:Uma2 family endonuclease